MLGEVRRRVAARSAQRRFTINRGIPLRVLRNGSDGFFRRPVNVQAKIQQRRRSNPGAAYRTHTRRNSDRYLLSGLVYCARCNCKMHGANSVAKGRSYPKYVCSTYCRSGKNNPHGCGCHGMHQDQLVEVLVRKLQQTVLTTANLNRLREALRKQIDRRRTTNLSGADTRRKQLNELNREIDRAAENFLRAPAEILDLVAEKLTALKRRREHLQKELRIGDKKVPSPCTTLFITILCFANRGSRSSTRTWRFEVVFGGVGAEATLS